MTEQVGGGTSGTGDQGGGATPPARPEWLPEKFFTADKGPDYEGLARSYAQANSLIGKRVGELNDEQRAALLEIARQPIGEALEKDLRAKLAADDEFLRPILDAKLDELRPKAPDEYALDGLAPEGWTLEPENEAFKKLVGYGKEWGLSQEQFAKVLALGFELMPQAPTLEERIAEIGPDYKDRATRLMNAATAMAERAAGADPKGRLAARAEVDALFGEVMSADGFRALERLVAAAGERPLPSDQNPAADKPPTQEDYDAALNDERYRRKEPKYMAHLAEMAKRIWGGDRL